MIKWFFLLLTALVVISFPTTHVSAHDLTDREVESINSSMELGIAEDMVYLDYWIAVGELEALSFRSLIDANNDGSVSEEEKEVFLNKIQQELTYSGLRLQIDDKVGTFALYASRMEITDTKTAPVALKINFEFLYDLQRLDRYEDPATRIGKKHSLIFWMTNTLPKPVMTKVFIAQMDGIDIPYTVEQRKKELMFKAGFWLKPQEYNAVQLDYVYTGVGEPKFDRPKTVAGSNVGKEKMVGFLQSQSLSFWVIVIAIFLAFVYGAGHALAPGHGKTLVGAYLIGSRGTIKQAIILGLIVTATHLSSVIVAGIIALSASHYINQTALAVYLAMLSGLIIIIMGVWIFRQRLKNPIELEHHHHHHGIFGHGHSHDEHHDEHHPPHDAPWHKHEDGTEHSHEIALPTQVEAEETAQLPKVQFKQILALGISGGLVPCPTAIIVLLTAISMKKTLWGLFLISSFSLGLAAVLIGIGILMVKGSSLIQPSKKILGIETNTIIKVVSIASPILFTLIGFGIIFYELTTSGVLIIWNPNALP